MHKNLYFEAETSKMFQIVSQLRSIFAEAFWTCIKMEKMESYQFLIGNISGTLLAVGDGEVLTLVVHAILAGLASDGGLGLDAFAANVAKLALQWTRLRPTVWHWILCTGRVRKWLVAQEKTHFDDVGSDGGARRDDRLEASIVDHEVADCGCGAGGNS